MASNLRLKKISELSQVSISTVSRVLTNNGYVSQESRERVLNALAELSGGSEKAAKVRRRLSIALVAPEEEFINSDTSTSIDIESLVKTLEGDGNKVLQISNYEKDFDAFVQVLKLKKVDVAIIFDPPEAGELTAALAEASIPFLVTNGYGGKRTPFVVDYDNFGGAFRATEHLIELGHRSIGFISGNSEHMVSNNRLDGCREAFAKHGLPWRPELVEAGHFKLNGGFTACSVLFERHPKLTALFAFNDLSAVGAIRAIRDKGLRVPGDVSVVGFDDMEIAKYADPPLTTVSRYSPEINPAISHLVQDLAQSERMSQGALWFRADLIVRESTGPKERDPSSN